MRVLEIDIFRDVSCVGACERGKLSAEKSWRHRPSTNQPGRNRLCFMSKNENAKVKISIQIRQARRESEARSIRTDQPRRHCRIHLQEPRTSRNLLQLLDILLVLANPRNIFLRLRDLLRECLLDRLLPDHSGHVLRLLNALSSLGLWRIESNSLNVGICILMHLLKLVQARPWRLVRLVHRAVEKRMLHGT